MTVQIQLSLVRMLSNVQRLSLFGTWVPFMHYGGGFRDQLPVFHNLITLELGENQYNARWDILLLEFFNSSPRLETLAFPEGLYDRSGYNGGRDHEDKGWRTIDATPGCL